MSSGIISSNGMFDNEFPKSTWLRNENWLFQKKSKWGLRKNPGILRFVTLHLEILEKASSLKIFLNCVTPLAYSKTKNQNTWKFPMILLDHSWKFHLFFYWTLESLHEISSITPRNTMPCPQLPTPPPPPCWVFTTGTITHTSSSHNTWNSTTK